MPEESAHLVEAFRGGLKDGGFIEGQSVSFEFRWARGDYGRLPALAAELDVSSRVLPVKSWRSSLFCGGAAADSTR